MDYQFEFRPYQRRFKQPLHTSHGMWKYRQGIVLRLTNEAGKMGWGEIAPLSWFGSESIEQALEFCQQLPSQVTDNILFSVPPTLPACQFGFESAWEVIGERGSDKGKGRKDATKGLPIESYSGLLQAGEEGLQAWRSLWQQGYRTFKWKIGVAPIQNELSLFERLVQLLPDGAKLRLDANGGLSLPEAKDWLKHCDVLADGPIRLEFLEQPLPPDQVDVMSRLSQEFITAIALDESVATVDQLEACYQRGWRGIFVVKAAIAGSPTRLRQFCLRHKLDMVFSSVFESAIARRYIETHLINDFPQQRAMGFGINHWFTETDETWLEHLWNP